MGQWVKWQQLVLHCSTTWVNSSVPGRFEWHLRKVIFKIISVIGGWGNHSRNCPQINVTGPWRWQVNIISDNGFVPSGNNSQATTWADVDLVLCCLLPYAGNAWVRSQHCGYWCPGAKAPGHQYPQCWLNIHCIGPVPYKNIAHKVNSIRKWNHILKKTRQIWGIWKLRPAYSPEMPNLGQNRWCFWRMTLKNNRAPLLFYFKLCASFRNHWCIETWVTVRKRPIWFKFDDF